MPWGALDVDEYCRRRGWWFGEYHPVVRNLTITDSQGRPYHSSRGWVACMKDVQVISDGFLVTGDGIICRGLGHCNCSVFLHGELIEAYPEVLEPEAEIPEAILCWGTGNFGHWVWQHLARLTLIEERKEIPVLLSDRVPGRFHEWVRALGFQNLVIAGDWVKVKKLWVPSVVNYRGHYEDNNCYISPRSVRSLRSKLGRIGKPKRRLYFSRARDSWRKIVNEEEVIRNLPGFEIVEFSGMGMVEQLTLVGEAEAIVVPCGGASPVTLFAPESCKILELNNGTLQADFGSRAWAGILGQEFERLDGESVGDGKMINRDYVIDTEKLDSRLESLCL